MNGLRHGDLLHLSPEDAAARDRFVAHLRALDPDAHECRVTIEAEAGGGFHVCATLRSYGGADDVDRASIVSRATRTTVGAALCEAARLIGVAL